MIENIWPMFIIFKLQLTRNLMDLFAVKIIQKIKKYKRKNNIRLKDQLKIRRIAVELRIK